MAIPKVSRDDILNALQFVDENGVPAQNKSTRYFLLGENGKSYPPKYVKDKICAEYCKHEL